MFSSKSLVLYKAFFLYLRKYVYMCSSNSKICIKRSYTTYNEVLLFINDLRGMDGVITTYEVINVFYYYTIKVFMYAKN